MRPNSNHLPSCPRRSPHGERGLKCLGLQRAQIRVGSLSSWRAWIEIKKANEKSKAAKVALLMESVD